MLRIEGCGPQASQIVPFCYFRNHAYRQCPLNALCIQTLCFLLMRITLNNYGLVKVVNNASGTRLAGGCPQTGMQNPIESECKAPIFT